MNDYIPDWHLQFKQYLKEKKEEEEKKYKKLYGIYWKRHLEEDKKHEKFKQKTEKLLKV